MRFSAAALIALSAALAWAQEPAPVEQPVALEPATLPEAIQHLAPVYDQPAAFVQGLRDWGKAQIRLAEADLEQAKQLARARKQEEAKAKRDSAVAKTRAVREAYEFGLKKYSEDARLVNAYGELLYDQFGENAGALRAWHQAISLDPKYAPPYNNLGLDQCHSGQYETGIANLEKALALDPKNPDFMFNIAQIYLIHFPQVEKIKKWKPKKIYQRAMALSKEATETAPEDFELAEDYALNFLAAENFKVEADWEAAAAAWQRARGLTQAPDKVFNAWLNEARCWSKAGEAERAVPCVEEALKILPDSAPAKQLLEKLRAAPEPAPEKKKRGN